jgi:hypothetical protein
MTGPTIEVMAVANGFVIRPCYNASMKDGGYTYQDGRDVFVFNTIEAVYEWMKANYKNDADSR